MKDLEKTLKTITEQAPALRTAGVASVTVGNVKIDLLLPDPPAPQTTGQDGEKESDRDPLDDPETYGGYVPQRRRGADRGMRDDDDDDDGRG